jgi:cytochrome P450
MTEEAARATERWKPGMTFDVTREMNRVTMRVIGRTLFGADIRDDAGEVSAAIGTMIDLFDQKFLPPAAITDRLPLQSTRRFDAAERTLDATITRLIRDRRARPGVYDDLLDTLLAAGDEDGNDAMTDRQVRDDDGRWLAVADFAEEPDVGAEPREALQRALMALESRLATELSRQADLPGVKPG